MKLKTRTGKKTIAVIDFETDPFLHGRIPEVFAAGFYDGEAYVYFWGTQEYVLTSLVDFLDNYPTPLIVYAHNGGKFDFFYLLRFFGEGEFKLVNGRILKATRGKNEFRDSYGVMPIALSQYAKESIDYKLMESTVREKYKGEILTYLRKDCEYLYDLVSAFWGRFGNKLTIGGTAMAELKKLHPVERCDASHDALFRPFYFGGRVQCLEPGHDIKGDWKVYDVNSMYPYVMKNFLHPIGHGYAVLDSLNLNRAPKMYFAEIEADNYGAFCLRDEETGRLEFPTGRHRFFTTSHEINAARETGMAKNIRIIRALVPRRTQSFSAYVDKYVREKQEAKKNGDKVSEIFSKLLLNSAYGKFGQNPENFREFALGGIAKERMRDGFTLYEEIDGFIIWEKPSPVPSYFDVAIAASVTGAARSVLMRALAVAKRPAYCDTDSIVCEALPLPQDALELGAWKLEAKGNTLHIAGKKLYALFDNDKAIKSASKGANLEPEEIAQIARGMVHHWRNDAPNFKLNGAHKFVDRKIRSLYYD